MKDRKKPKGTKARVQAYKKRLTYIGHAIVVGVLAAIIVVSSFFLYSMLYSPPEQTLINPTLQFKPDNPNPQLKAAIVDHLSLTFPNQTFVQTAARILIRANYTVDYYSGEKVIVEFYRNLPTHAYKMIILRVHSAVADVLALFTSEPYSNKKYIGEQLTDQLGFTAYSEEDVRKGIIYFGIRPSFITESMKGSFQNTMVIMMGCEGLKGTAMAEAFVKKGVKVYMSWSDSVSATHTDTATTQLLRHLITEKQTIKQAVQETLREVGPDPAHNSTLLYYPP